MAGAIYNKQIVPTGAKFINEDFFVGQGRTEVFGKVCAIARRSRKLAESAVQRKKDHLWPENNYSTIYQIN